MELIQFLQVLLRRWYLIVIPVAVAAVIAVPALLARGPQSGGGFTTVIRYTAAQVLEAIPNRDGDYQDVWLASELAVNAFTEWIRSGSFAAEVRAALPEDQAENALAASFAADNERSIGQLFVSHPDADALRAIVEAAQQVLATQTGAYFPQLGGQPARVSILDTPQINAAPPPITSRLGPVLQLGVALIAGIALAFLVEYLDPFIYRREQIETLDVRVITSIPKE